MNSQKVRAFIELAGNRVASHPSLGTAELRSLGAGLLLSETLEYIIKGLGLRVRCGNALIEDPQDLSFEQRSTPSQEEMLDGLADVAYTMYWNALTFGMPVEDAFSAVCDNNLQKFVEIEADDYVTGSLPREEWHLRRNITWPQEVINVRVIETEFGIFAVGKDENGKVRKPSSYPQLSLANLLDSTQTETVNSCQDSANVV